MATSVPKPQLRRPLGMAVVGGLFFSTFLTLVLVPVVYVLLGRFTKVEKRRGGEPTDGKDRIRSNVGGEQLPEGQDSAMAGTASGTVPR